MMVNSYDVIYNKINKINELQNDILYEYTDDKDINNINKLSSNEEINNKEILIESYSKQFDNIEFIVYLLKLDSVPITKFDENYCPITMYTPLQYETGIIIHNKESNIKQINGINRSFTEDFDKSKINYNDLMNLINENSIENIFLLLIKKLDNEINELLKIS